MAGSADLAKVFLAFCNILLGLSQKVHHQLATPTNFIQFIVDQVLCLLSTFLDGLALRWLLLGDPFGLVGFDFPKYVFSTGGDDEAASMGFATSGPQFGQSMPGMVGAPHLLHAGGFGRHQFHTLFCCWRDAEEWQRKTARSQSCELGSHPHAQEQRRERTPPSDLPSPSFQHTLLLSVVSRTCHW